MSRRRLWLPPPGVVAITALLMWSCRRGSEWGLIDFPGRAALALVILGAGLLVMVVAAGQLLRARTTLLPFRPAEASQLVTGGLFRWSRNPIYLGDLLLLLAWALWLGSLLNLPWLVLFVVYMNRVQIAAEEQALSEKFGAAYLDYRARVRRWL
ncbi:isoprenylcysteine carboxylmethyltransferase family protein [Zobellella endophytica]|uniref:Isoprenylcysteine carboxylmethyltransferase family protein n=1 Tax=Zobellella endophytica TaxID=2116700 RepID=A0A2P7QQT9_9GAMM|nr:isoprenylcysteine carboxylmethyltransferase family protein [Zobellella endophytica]PSJ40333.1 isoprenylcysteine carboxylmethyltransferase family protein [Zobellella endophytica]